jgi:putative nucleotidyltransferase with HDIG domain
MVSEEPARILVVEDDAAFGGMIAEALCSKGYAAVCFQNPREAVERATSDRFAAALVDLVMPSMGGLEVADRLKADSPDTQVIVLTGHGDMDSAIEGIRHGIFDFVTKADLHLGRLERVVAEAVEKSNLTRRNRELVERLEDSNRLLQALHGASTAIAAEAHLDRLLARVVSAAASTCRAAFARALLFERVASGELVIRMAEGDGAETLRGTRLQPGEGIATVAAETDESILVLDPARHPRFSRRCDEFSSPVVGLICAPLRHRRVIGSLMIAGRLDRPFGAPEQEALTALARQAAVAIDNAEQHERSVNFFTHACDILVSFLEAMDIHYPGHSHNVAAFADMLTRRLGLPEEERRTVHFAALLHDIGKVRLDKRLLEHEGRPSAASLRMLQEHPRLGLEILRPITLWEDILHVIHAHHERWDGKGYPRGLSGEEIPLGARVIAVADVFDAMGRPQSQKGVRPPEAQLAELEACAGTQFDPRIVRLFVSAYREQGDPRPKKQ